MALDIEQAELEHREQPDRAGADDERVSGDDVGSDMSEPLAESRPGSWDAAARCQLSQCRGPMVMFPSFRGERSENPEPISCCPG